MTEIIRLTVPEFFLGGIHQPPRGFVTDYGRTSRKDKRLASADQLEGKMVGSGL